MNDNHQRVAVIGLGYVGTVSAACLSDDGNTVIGVDVNDYKIESLNSGHAPIAEPGLDELVRQGHESGRLTATKDLFEAVQNSDLALICVGTPSNAHGGLELGFVKRVCEQLGEAIAKRDAASDYVVVVRSTILPTSMSEVVRPALEASSGLKADVDFHTAFNPEFLREGSAISDYRCPPKIVVGTESDTAEAALKKLYHSIEATYIRTSTSVAEMVKYVDNAWHAAKVTFGNEVGEICHRLGIDSHRVMDIFIEDKQLNISKAYLKPGFAFGGSCLPKDLRAILHFSRHADITLPMMGAILESNTKLIERVAQTIRAKGVRKIGLWGLSFKPATDDLRESPSVVLAEKLIGSGCSLKIYDPLVKQSIIMGSNRAYIDDNIPHFESLLIDDKTQLADSELVIMSHRTADSKTWLETNKGRVPVLDLARVLEEVPEENYEGVSW